MAIIRCPSGHFYDNEKHSMCPICNKSSGPRWELDNEKTVSLESIQEDSDEVTVRLTAGEPEKEKIRGSWDSEKTVAFWGQEAELLVGWLVCTKGTAKGKDFRLYPGFNRIGRSLSSDICLQDPGVSGENHCSVVYDRKSRSFYLMPGNGTLTYLDGEIAGQAEPLTDGVPITLGESTLELVSFCKGDHVWETL